MNSLIPGMLLVVGAVICCIIVLPALCSDVAVSDNLTVSEENNLDNVNAVGAGLLPFWSIFAFAGVVILILIVFLRSGK